MGLCEVAFGPFGFYSEIYWVVCNYDHHQSVRKAREVTVVVAMKRSLRRCYRLVQRPVRDLPGFMWVHVHVLRVEERAYLSVCLCICVHLHLIAGDLIYPDTEIMFAFSFSQPCWFVTKLGLTAPVHQAHSSHSTPPPQRPHPHPPSLASCPMPPHYAPDASQLVCRLCGAGRLLETDARATAGRCLRLCVTGQPWALVVTFTDGRDSGRECRVSAALSSVQHVRRTSTSTGTSASRQFLTNSVAQEESKQSGRGKKNRIDAIFWKIKIDTYVALVFESPHVKIRFCRLCCKCLHAVYSMQSAFIRSVHRHHGFHPI